MKINLLTIITIIFFTGLIHVNAATVSFFIGKVEVKKNKIWSKAKVGQPLYANNQIRTSKNSLALITFKKGSTLKMRQNSSLILNQIGTATNESVSLNLLKGSVFSKILKRNSGEIYHIKTGTVVVAVRGTDFFVAQEQIKPGRKDLWVCVNEGSINITETSNKKSVIVPQGKGVLIKAGQHITAPKVYRWTQELNWSMDYKAGDVIDRVDILKAYYDLLDFDYD